MFSDGSACKTAMKNVSQNGKGCNSKTKVRWYLLLSSVDIKP